MKIPSLLRSFHLISNQCSSVHSNSFQFIHVCIHANKHSFIHSFIHSFHLISCHFISFHSVSFHFISFIISFVISFISFSHSFIHFMCFFSVSLIHFIALHVMSCHFILVNFMHSLTQWVRWFIDSFLHSFMTCGDGSKPWYPW